MYQWSRDKGQFKKTGVEHCPTKAANAHYLPPFDEVEGVSQPQGPQHEQQTEDGHFSCAFHQRLGQED